MKRGRGRGLDAEDRRLWDHVRRTAVPLRPGTEPDREPEEPPAEPAAPAAPAASVAVPARPAPRPAPPPGGLDRRTLTRLGRGSVAIDARIDLHGLTQDAAHRRLLRFLEAARGEGARIVLVITGKGGTEGGEGGRGVLRRAVPEWLGASVFRQHVSGYESAGRRHGGEGAFYVRLRRKGAADGRS